MAQPTLTSNSPSAGFISWTAFNIAYDGVAYALDAGSTSMRYVYWSFATGGIVTTDALPDTLTADDLVLFLNDGGIAISAQNSRFIDGSLIVDGTIAAKAIKTEQLVIGRNVSAFEVGYDPSTKATPEEVTASQEAAQAYADSLATGAINLVTGGEVQRSSHANLQISTYPALADYVGETITLSFDIMGDHAGSVNLYAYQQSGISIGESTGAVPVTTEWVRLSRTTTVKQWTAIPNPTQPRTDGSIIWNDHTNTYISGESVFYLRNVKVELGSQATPWSPSTQDMKNMVATAKADAIADAALKYDNAKLAVATWTYPSTTEIDGGYLRTGTVAANQIVVGNGDTTPLLTKTEVQASAAAGTAESNAAVTAQAKADAAKAAAIADAAAKYDNARLRVVDWTYPNSTEIHGSLIRTGTVAANQIVVGGGDSTPLLDDLADLVANTVNQYAASTSETVAPTTGWSTTAPTRTPGSYIWFRTTLTRYDGTTSTTSAALLTGNDGAPGTAGSQGIPGPAGTNGQSLYTWLKYADTPTTGMSDLPAGKTYMGLAHNKASSTESSTYSDYSWSLIQGPQGNTGVQGPAGANGQPTYTWIKYATNATGTTGFADVPTGATYIGLAHNKTTATESATPGDYSWSLIQGPQGATGATGSQGIQGPAGANGAATYVWLKYADSPTTGMSDLPAGKTYMGLAYNKSTATESSNYTDYDWSLIQGPQGNTGVQGPTGANGTPTYTWIKYATNATGTAGFSDSPAGATYIGLAHNKATAAESATPGDYQWSLIQGPQGATGSQGATGAQGPQGNTGVQGPAGANGQTYYTWIKYADTPTTGMSDLPAGKTYMGLAYNKTTATESSTYSDYEWALIQGPQGNTGVQGPAGANGQATYTWVKYADSATGAGLSDSPTGKAYMGLAYNKTTATESSVTTDYAWALIQGAQGPTGSTGATGSTGSTGTAGVSVTAVTPYYARLASGAAAPAKPGNVLTPPAPWVATEPAYAAGNELWTTERISYSSGIYSYTTVVKSSSYTAASAAQDQIDAWKMTGKTTIDGGKIETDSVKAAQIDAGAISVDKLSAGSIETMPLRNGTFEDVDAAGKALAWTMVANGTGLMPTTTTTPIGGARSGLLTGTSAAAQAAQSDTFPVRGGSRYMVTGSTSVKAAGTSGTRVMANISIIWLNSSFGVISTQSLIGVTTPIAPATGAIEDWKRIPTAPAGSAHARVKITSGTNGTGTVETRFDALRVEPEGNSAPVGSLMPYAGSTAPYGWLICDGSMVPRAAFPDLADVLGANGYFMDAQWVVLPDLRNRVARGGTPATYGGSDTVQMPDHAHWSGSYVTGASTDTMTRQGGTNATVSHTNHTHTVTGQSGLIVGSNPAISNVPSYAGLTYIIKT